MPHTVSFTREAEGQLVDIFRYIARETSPEIARRYTNGIVTYCKGLATFLV